MATAYRINTSLTSIPLVLVGPVIKRSLLLIPSDYDFFHQVFYMTHDDLIRVGLVPGIKASDNSSEYQESIGK